MRSIYVFGHKNPDTDSVCSAIALANLKNKQGINCVPKVIGPINHGTKYVLDYFKVEKPSYINDVKVQIKDMKYLKKAFVYDNDNVYNTYNFLKTNSLHGVPVVDKHNHINGYVTMKDIANYLVSDKRNILDANINSLLNILDATVLVKCKKEFKGIVNAVTFSSDEFIKEIKLTENSVLIVGDRPKVIEYAINNKIQLIILTRNRRISDALVSKAQENNVTIISSSYSSFDLCNKLSLTNYVEVINTHIAPITLELTSYYSDFINLTKKYNYSNYPIINNNKECVGLIKLTDSQNYNKKQVILVDHNNYEQSIDGLREADIVEIIDHHNLGNIGTNIPISFISRPVGCTSTIIYDEYKKARIRPSRSIAGLLLSAIISDTLLLTSPTTTDLDIAYAKELAVIAKLNLHKYGIQMLKEASSIKGLSVNELINQDFKSYSINDKTYGIAVITTMDYDEIAKNIDKYINKLNEMSEDTYEAVLIFIADIIKKGSYILYNAKSQNLISNAFNIDAYEGIFIPNLLSRKSQILPSLMKELEK